MRVTEIMSTDVNTIQQDEPKSRAHELMRLHSIRHLVVVNGKQIVGVVSDRDLGGKHGGASRDSATVASVMSAPAIIVSPQTSLRDAANQLRGRTIGCLPVVDGNRLVGMITATDILEVIGRGAEKPSPEGERKTLKKRGPRRGHPQVSSH